MPLGASVDRWRGVGDGTIKLVPQRWLVDVGRLHRLMRKIIHEIVDNFKVDTYSRQGERDRRLL